MTETELTQTVKQTRGEYEIAELAQTEMSQTQTRTTEEMTVDEINDNKNNVVIVPAGDEIKCCNKIDIYTGLYIIFGYNIFIALLLLLIIIWSTQMTSTDIMYFLLFWGAIFLIIRLYISIFGFVLVPVNNCMDTKYVF